MQVEEHPGIDGKAENIRIYLQPCIIVLAGLPLVGKSTIGREIKKQSNLVFLDIDQTRREMYPHIQERLSPEQKRIIMLQVYKRNHEKARENLSQGRPVLIAATYSRRVYHEMIKILAKETNSPLRVFLLGASEEKIHERLAKRRREGDLSNIRTFKAYQEVKNRYEIIQEVILKRINTNQELAQNIEQICHSLVDLTAHTSFQ